MVLFSKPDSGENGGPRCSPHQAARLECAEMAQADRHGVGGQGEVAPSAEVLAGGEALVAAGHVGVVVVE